MNARDFRKLAHLIEQVGEVVFQALINSDNTSKVKEFCDKLVVLPSEMTILSKTYGILQAQSLLGMSFHSEAGHTHVVSSATALKKLNEMLVHAHCRENDVKHILKYQDRIPRELRGKTILFTGWQDSRGRIAKIYYNPQKGRWDQYWQRIDLPLSCNNYVAAYRQS